MLGCDARRSTLSCAVWCLLVDCILEVVPQFQGEQSRPSPRRMGPWMYVDLKYAKSSSMGSPSGMELLKLSNTFSTPSGGTKARTVLHLLQWVHNPVRVWEGPFQLPTPYSQNGYPPTSLPLRYGRDWENFIFLILTLIIWKVQVSLTLILRKFLPSLVGIFGRPQIWPQSTMASIHGGLSPPGLSPPGLNSPGFNPAVTDLNWQKQEKLSFSQENW